MNPVKEVQKTIKSAQNFIKPIKNYSNTNLTKNNQSSSKNAILNPPYLVKPAIETQNHKSYATITNTYQNTNESYLAQCSNSKLTPQNQKF